MPVIGKTKIVPEYLKRTYQKLRSTLMDLLGKKEPTERRKKK
jgi:hypothetical protein